MASDNPGAPADTTDSGSGAEPEYSIEGFNVEFSFKVALTPPAPPGSAAPAPKGARTV